MNENITILTKKECFEENSKLEILKKYGMKAAISDYAILLGGYVSNNYYAIEGENLENRTGYYWTRSSDGDGNAQAVAHNGEE